MSDILNVRDGSGTWHEIPAITGLSAYQIAVKNGFVGTEEAWLESLKGEQGVPGVGGSTGPQGPAGPGVPTGGTAGQFLAKKTAANYDTQWVDPPTPTSTGVTSFNGRTGAVTPQSGDYTAAQVGARPSTWMPTASDVGAVSTTGNASNTTVAFTQASTRANISTGEKLSVMFGKLAKWFADLKTVAFTGSYNDLTNKPTIPTTAADVGAVPTTRKVNNKALSADISLTASDVGARASTWTPTAADVGALPITGGTLTGNLTIKGSGNFGTKINLGDGDYVHIAEPTDDCLEIKAKKINFVVSATTTDKFTLNGESIGGGSGSATSMPASGLTGTVAIANGGTGTSTAAAALYALVNGSSALTSSGIADGDYIALGDVSATTGKKITFANLKAALGTGNGSDSNVVVGTYTGNQSMPSASASVQSQQNINLGFEPQCVFVWQISSAKDTPPWYYYENSDEKYLEVKAAFAMPDAPYYGEQGSGSPTEIVVLETYASGFSVRNARFSSSGAIANKEYWTLNKSGIRYGYLAIK